ncbi:VOC family protein [Pseudochelatococcus sp. B33]
MKSTGYKPEGRPDVSVYIMAQDAAAVIDFAVEVLDAVELMKLERPDGSLRHGEYRIGDSTVMLSQATEEYPAFPVWLHVYVPDVDAAYRKALALGATSVQAPTRAEDAEDTDRRGGVRDGAGNVWWISTFEG